MHRLGILSPWERSQWLPWHVLQKAFQWAPLRNIFHLSASSAIVSASQMTHLTQGHTLSWSPCLYHWFSDISMHQNHRWLESTLRVSIGLWEATKLCIASKIASGFGSTGPWTYFENHWSLTFKYTQIHPCGSMYWTDTRTTETSGPNIDNSWHWDDPRCLLVIIK